MNIWKWFLSLFQPNNAEGDYKHDLNNETEQPEIISLNIDHATPDCLKEPCGSIDETLWNYQKPIGDEISEDVGQTESAESENIKTIDDVRYEVAQKGERVNQTKKKSLLEDDNLVRLFSECTSLIDMMEKLSQGMTSENEQLLVQMVKQKVYDALLLSGGTAINNDLVFDNIRHKGINCLDAKNGMQIVNIVAPGLLLEDRVFLRAKVNVKID